MGALCSSLTNLTFRVFVVARLDSLHGYALSSSQQIRLVLSFDLWLACDQVRVHCVSCVAPLQLGSRPLLPR